MTVAATVVPEEASKDASQFILAKLGGGGHHLGVKFKQGVVATRERPSSKDPFTFSEDKQEHHKQNPGNPRSEGQ
ncbi:hypothetical protein V6N12_062469 [Hibiscus sabdariffa]|uniref:Uncharacterized protein n=1 Tax=Hibiscus sabdariffa TaxID=183260 RepID=A0ABR2F8Y5_9ROSI